MPFFRRDHSGAAALAIAVALFCGAAAVLTAYSMIAQERQRLANRIAEQAAAAARLMASDTERSFEAIDLFGRGVAQAFIRQGEPIEALDAKKVEWIKATLDRVPQIEAIMMADADGVARFAVEQEGVPGEDPAGVALGDRAYFQAARAAARRGETRGILGKPVYSRTGMGWLLPVSWPLVDKGGEFAGIVAMTLDREYFLDRARTAFSTYRGSAALLYPDGTLFSLNADRSIGNAGQIAGLFSEGTGPIADDTALGPVMLDGRKHLAHAAKAQAAGLTVVTAIDKASALADLDNRAMVIYSGVGAGLLLLLVATALIIRAVISQRDALRAARSADQAKSDFVAALSHEIRTPLNSVLGMVQLLRQSALGPAQQRYADTILRAGEHLNVILNEVLDYSKLAAGKFALVEEPFCLRTFVDDLCEWGRVAAEQKGLGFKTQVSGDLPRVIGDGTRLKQIVLNYISNSLKFTDDGEITLAVDTARTNTSVSLRLAVRDTGIGVAPDKLDELFQEFSQVGSDANARHGGTGLGLSIVKGLAKLMGGTVGVESVPGAGSIFWVDLALPLCPDTVEGVEGEGGSAVTVAEKPLRILVADDNTANRDIAAAMLEKAGHRVTTVGDGGAALAFAKSQRFDAIILDIEMPGTDGVAVAHSLRGLACPAKLIAVTGRSEGSLSEADTTALFDNVFGKPVDWSSLLAFLHRITSAAALRDNEPVGGIGSVPERSWDDASVAALVETIGADETASLVQQMLDQARSLAADLATADDDERVVALAHELKGMAGNFGAQRVSALAAELERGGRNGEGMVSMEPLVNALQREIVATQRALPSSLSRDQDGEETPPSRTFAAE